MSAPTHHLELYKSRTGWRWRVRHRNGLVVANGGQGYTRRIDARRAFERMCAAWGAGRLEG